MKKEKQKTKKDKTKPSTVMQSKPSVRATRVATSKSLQITVLANT